MWRHVALDVDALTSGRCSDPACPSCVPVRDEEVPLFARLRADLGLPRANRSWWPDGVPTEVSDPTLELLERTLAALRGTLAPASSE